MWILKAWNVFLFMQHILMYKFLQDFGICEAIKFGLLG